MLANLTSNYWATWFPGSMVAVTVLLGLLWKGLRALYKVTDALPTLYLIHAEFSPNGGESLKDRVEALHVAEVTLAEAFHEHVGDDNRNFRKVDGTLVRIEGLLGDSNGNPDA